MSRRTKIDLPTRGNLLKPKVMENVGTKIKYSKDKQSCYYNRGSKDLPKLHPGDAVRMQPDKYQHEWRKGEVKRKVNTRSYEVMDENNRTYRRNRKFLHKTPETVTPPVVPVEIDSPSSTGQTPAMQPEKPVPASTANTASHPEPRRSGRIRTAPTYLQEYTT
jgi:hypothetical protein